MINGVPRILIVRLSAIGDVVRVLPALHALRDAFPNGQIDWAVERKSAPIVEDNPWLDRLLVFERPKGALAGIGAFRKFCKTVRAGHYDIVMDFHGISKSGMITRYSRAPQRYGFARPRAQELSYLFTNYKVKLPSKDLNRVEENLRLCRALCPGHEVLDVYRGYAGIVVPPDVQDEVNAFYEETFGGGKLIVAMHVPVDRPEKKWPAEYFAALADRLLADGRFEVVLTWGPGQFDAVEEVRKLTRRNPVVAPATTELKHYAWLAHRADLYFGGDTGPMHIAAAMGTPVVAVFGGTDPGKHAPYQKPCKILRCDDKSLPVDARLRRITPDMAYDACVEQMTSEF